MIEIGDYRVQQNDPLNWVICKRVLSKKGKNKGENTYPVIGYYVDFSKCLVSLLEKLIKDGYEYTENFQDILDLIKESEEAIIEEVQKMEKS